MIESLLNELGVDLAPFAGDERTVHSPRDGKPLARLRDHRVEEVQQRIAQAHEAFTAWRNVPAPVRGELVRLFGEVLREHKAPLGRLVSLECGKITSEGLGEVQE